MLQTFWQFNRQNIRKLVDMAMGTLAGYAFFTTEWGVLALSAIGLVVNYLWFYLDNKTKVTVEGLEEAGKGAAAVAVETAVKAAKKAGK